MYVYLQEKKAQQLADTTKFPHAMALSMALSKAKHAWKMSMFLTLETYVLREEKSQHTISPETVQSTVPYNCKHKI